MSVVAEALLMYSTQVYRDNELVQEFEHLYPDTEMLEMIGIMESRHTEPVAEGEEVPGVRVHTVNTDSNTVVFDHTYYTLKGNRNG
jgi:hypothetical protein